MKRRWRLSLVILLCLLAGCNNSWSSGDRVLVSKFIYETDLAKPQREDVVVFKYPREPIKGGVPTNYIKRLLGLAGETLAIFFGQLYETRDLTYPEDQDPTKVDPLELWRPQYMHHNDDKALDLFRAGKFRVVRKQPETILALRRIVYDNDHQAKDLKDANFPPRWAPEGKNAWAEDKDLGFQAAQADKGAATSWLRYRHILRPEDWPAPAWKARQHKPQLITDFSGYNSYELEGGRNPPSPNWVGSLMLEFELKVDGNQGELLVELAKSVDRFQARWDLATGKCTLVRLQDAGGRPRETVLGSADTRVSQPGTYQLRLANFDDRLTLWVDRDLPFDGGGVNYDHAWSFDRDKGLRGEFVNVGPTANDLKPASIGVKGAAVQVHHVKLWRDTYYTRDPQTGADAQPPPPRIPEEARHDPERRASAEAQQWAEFWGDPSQWDPLRAIEPATWFVQPKHYMCLGDNSPESSDSRTWGTVPERLLLGRALVVYFPFSRLGPIH